MNEVVQSHVEGEITEEEVVICLALVTVWGIFVGFQQFFDGLSGIQEVIVRNLGEEEMMSNVTCKVFNVIATFHFKCSQYRIALTRFSQNLMMGYNG